MATVAILAAKAASPKKRWLELLPFFAFFILLFILTARLPFFGDKDILFSKIAFWLLDHNFSLILPEDLDIGYPPALGYLLAFTWKITGKSLFSAHFLMLPFTLGIVWQTRNLLDYFFGGRFIIPSMVLLFADTTILAQTVLFSTDLVMLFFMLLALNAIIHERRGMLTLAVAGLLFSHTRGIMVAVTLGIFEIYRNTNRKSMSVLLHIATPYIPALTLFIAWMLFHYYRTGWVLYHAASPWSGCFERVNGAGLARNAVIYVWRLVDYGRLFVWLVPALALLKFNRRNLMADPVIKALLFLMMVTLLLNTPTMMIYKILNNHRYLISFYYFLSMLAAYLLFVNPGFPRVRKTLAVLVIAGFISGSFWVYPGKIANGWDATLAHLPYHNLRKKMIGYIDENKIPFENVGSEVPNIVEVKYIELNDDERVFPPADLVHNQYVFYSNVFNMFTDEEIDELNNKWILQKEYRCMLVNVRLYRKPEAY